VDPIPTPVDLGRISQLFAAAAALGSTSNHSDLTRLAATISLPTAPVPTPQEVAASEATAVACAALEQAAAASAAFLKERHDMPHSQRLACINERITALTRLLNAEALGLAEADALADQLDAQLSVLTQKDRILRSVTAQQLGEWETSAEITQHVERSHANSSHFASVAPAPPRNSHAMRMQSLFGK
jgi:hypothetical protein